MISLMPSTTAADTSGAFAVIALVSDIEGSKKRLQELVDQAQENQKILADIAAAQQQAAADKAEAETILKAAHDAIGEHQKSSAYLADKQAQLQLMSESIAARSAELDAAMSEKGKAAAEREGDLARREADANKLLSKAQKDAAAAEKARIEYEGKLAKLQKAMV